MKKPMQRVGIAVMVLIVLLLGNLTYLQVVDAASLRSDPHNSRTTLDEFTRARGQIIAAGGAVLAQSVPSDDALRYQRQYPGGSMYTPVTGYYSTLYGATGIEKAQNAVLSGDSDDLIGGQLGDLITGRDPRGGNVQVTIVPAIQKAAYDALTSKGYSGAVVAIKPSTGEILALVSTPTYDVSALASHNEATQRKQSDIINANGGTLKLNRAIGQVYPPGSTFKLVMSGAAFQHGYTPDTQVTGRSTISLPGGGTLSNFDGETCGGAGGSDVSFTTALAYSCNTAFAQVGIALGADPIRAQATALGVDPAGSNVGLDVVGSRLGDMSDAQAVAQSSIGQRDVDFTPMQNAEIVAAIANGGTEMNPYLVARTTRPDLSVISTTQPSVMNQDAMSPGIAAQIKTMMIASEQNTAGSGAISGVTIASKTGTAEHGTDPKNTPPQCWYVAFAPADNPQVAVAVLVENGGNGDLAATGGKVASPIGRNVIRAALGGS